MNSILVSGNYLYLSRKYLAGFIHEDAIESWIRRQSVTSEGGYIKFDTIPAPSRAKLPTEVELRAKIKNDQYKEDFNELRDELVRAQVNTYSTHFEHLRKTYPKLKIEQCRDTAKKMGVFQCIRDKKARREVLKSDLLQDVLKELFPGEYEAKSGYYVMSNHISKVKKSGLDVLVDNRAFIEHTERIPPEQKLWIEVLMKNGKKYNGPEIHAKIKKACADAGIKPCSLSWIKKWMLIFKNNPELFKERHGSKATRESLPNVPLAKAKDNNTMWQIDGVVFPYWVSGKEDFERWTMVCVWDSHSRSVVGYSIGKSENTALIMAALDDAIRNAGCIATELVMDKHSFTKTEVAAHFREQTEKMGVIWTITTNPRQKNIAERYNQYFDPFFKEFGGYQGKGILSKSIEHHRNPDEIAQLRKTANQLSPDEIKAIGVYVIDQYNNTGIKPLKGMKPAEIYAEGIGVHAIKLSETDRISLVKPIKEYTVRSGQVVIQQGITRYTYQLPAALYQQYNNQKVSVHYEDLEQDIYLFDCKTSEHIATLSPVQLAASAKKDQEMDGIQPFLNNKGKLNGIAAAAKRDSAERLKAGLMSNPESMDIIKSYMMDKDIRQAIEQKRELSIRAMDMGIELDKIPVRVEKVAVIKADNESPFYKNIDDYHIDL